MRGIPRLVVALAACVTSACFYKPLSEGERSDPGIKARLEARLKADPSLDMRYVVVDVHMGIVTISGVVPSTENKRDIERAARRLRGVDQVLCNLLVQD